MQKKIIIAACVFLFVVSAVSGYVIRKQQNKIDTFKKEVAHWESWSDYQERRLADYERIYQRETGKDLATARLQDITDSGKFHFWHVARPISSR